jgi:geranylgeranyl diphosphate synthase type I
MDLPEYLERTADQVDKLFDRYFASETGELAKASAHLLLAGGKRLRPAVVLLAADAVKRGSSSDVIPAAIAMELTHSFTLIHDDIMDSDCTRRGVPTVHTKWDEPTAILAGDVLFARSFEFLCLSLAPENSKVRAVSMLARTCVQICEGQHMDMSFEKRDDVSEGEYLEMVSKKTGVLYAASAAIGSILAGGSPIYTDALYHYGQNIGLAFQIQDDLIDLVSPAERSGKDRGSDLREGKQTLITIKAKEKGLDLSKYRKALSAEELDVVIGELEAAGVIKEVQELARELVESGRAIISILPESIEKELLSSIGDFFITRSS